MNNSLVIIPTYNERENVEKICSEINNIGPGLDILFMDDNSPDGTGAIIDILAKRYQNVKAVHRPGKMGIGSAHLEGINSPITGTYEGLLKILFKPHQFSTFQIEIHGGFQGQRHIPIFRTPLNAGL